jgi:hypothetical protein
MFCGAAVQRGLEPSIVRSCYRANPAALETAFQHDSPATAYALSSEAMLGTQPQWLAAATKVSDRFPRSG